MAKPLSDITKCKLVFLDLVKSEMSKKRDHKEKGEPFFGDKSNAVSSAMLCLSDEYEKLLARLASGETMEQLIPDFKAYDHD